MEDFTSNEEFDDFTDRDPTTCVVGYVEAITAPAQAGTEDELLFKFILSNGSKRLEVLIWGSGLINQFCPKISSQRILDINGALCKAVTLNRFRQQNNFIPFEIIIKDYTTIEFKGFYKLNNKVSPVLKEVTFDNIHCASGLVVIKGYVRTNFNIVHNRTKTMSYGLGAITDGKRKINVQVKLFTSSTLELGDYVSVIGTIQDQDAVVTLSCDNMNSIKPVPDGKPLSVIEVRKGGKPIKLSKTEVDK